MAGIRVLYRHKGNSVYWGMAVAHCVGMQADLCDKAQYMRLRNHGYIGGTQWASDHSDNDNGGYEKGVGGCNDDTDPSHHYGYACCATYRANKDECPGGEFKGPGKGVCVIKLDGHGDWNKATNTCAELKARMCSISQVNTLRDHGHIGGSIWAADYGDNDHTGHDKGLGGIGDDHSPGENHNFACCL